ncbi:ribosome maturation factor RimM [Massilibacteroides sp.]|uniref:ribosome maturation factor RimM n=1 Tax=Massilibacteroides sp. TaxID=2034766 RepID=UPI002615DCA0|nr:ribosome maturation factor RimM [Massilibacteroides sp.]MDD4515514.1 ribosome maturation factor RimM [Massilibacteroides sp.]
MIRKEDIVKIGQFAKPHGIKGEIALVTSFDLFDADGDLYIICELDGIFVPFFIEESRYKSDSVVLLKLETLDSEEDVKPFTNKDVYCPKDWVENTAIDSGITWDNFIGYKVFDTQRGYLGEIEDIDDSTLNVIFQITHEQMTLLVPAVEDFIVKLEQDKKSITMTIPEGLFEL